MTAPIGKTSTVQALRPRRRAEVESLVRSFRYDEQSRGEIVEMLQPLYMSTVEAERCGKPAEEIVIEQLEWEARGLLRAYLNHVSPEQRRKHYEKVSRAASKLLELVNSGELEGGSAAYLIYNFGQSNQSDEYYSFLPLFIGALAQLSSKAAQAGKAKRPPYPGYEVPYPGKRDIKKIGFAQSVLMKYSIETNRRPGKSSTGPAAALLIAVIDPVIRFARSIGIDKASLIGTGDNAKTLIGDVRAAMPIGENLPEI
ncbi:hypothetical protein ACWGS9_19950 [Bradyrhizobium sp. Arg314]